MTASLPILPQRRIPRCRRAAQRDPNHYIQTLLPPQQALHPPRLPDRKTPGVQHFETCSTFKQANCMMGIYLVL